MSILAASLLIGYLFGQYDNRRAQQIGGVDMNISQLPYENIMEIALHLKLKDLLNFLKSNINDNTNEICKDKVFWKMYLDKWYILATLDKIIVDVAKLDHLDIVKCLVENIGFHKDSSKDWVIGEAAKVGHLDIVEYLVENVGIHDNSGIGIAIIDAAKAGHLETVRYLVEKVGFHSSSQKKWALEDAVKKGHLDIVKYLVENVSFHDSSRKDLAIIAARAGHQHIVEYLENLENI